MSDSISIKRKKGPVSPESAEGLKRKGLRFIQDLSAEIWTDYNLHDPGVTILEQLCYALTDLMYRAEAEPADLLTTKTGDIDFQKQALYPAHEIFPSQAITRNDYRKILFDAIPEIANVWVKTDIDQGGHSQGHYTIYVKLQEEFEVKKGLEASGNKAITDKVTGKIRTIYAENRNLCEDLHAVHIVKPRYSTLHGVIEISAAHRTSDLLAELYFKCAQVVTPHIPYTLYEEKIKEKDPDTLFTGPKTAHVYIEEDDLDAERDTVTLSEMIGIISRIEGVRRIVSLWFEDDAGVKTDTLEYDPSFVFVPALRIPEASHEVGLTLQKSGRTVPVSLKEIKVAHNRLSSRIQALRKTPQHFDGMMPLPKGTFQNFSEYYSIQNHFPEIYGINTYGVPASEPAERRAQAKQLKAYLLFFEQIMANFLANIAEIPRFFSLDATLDQSYFSQTLNNGNVPDSETLYAVPKNQLSSKIAGILKQYDPFFDRRGRLLDYLLGLYGEKFTQHSLRHFSDYYDDEETLEAALISNKINLLKQIVLISRKRAGAFNYEHDGWNSDNTAMLKKKVCLLLAIQFSQSRSLTDIFIEKGLELLSEDQYLRVKEGTVALEYVDLGDIEERIDQQFLKIPLRKSTQETSDEVDEIGLFNQIVFLKNNALSGNILRHGIDLERYRVGSTGNDQTFQLVFKPDQSERWDYLASYATMDEAVSAANALRRLLIRLNIESEGFHLIEHLLLRASNGKPHENIPDDFYAFKMSLVFPAWTARFHNKSFRKLAEETVRLNAPAHILAEFYWLEFHAMRRFEVCYKKWVQQKVLFHKPGSVVETGALDAAAHDLIEVLLENRTESPDMKNER